MEYDFDTRNMRILHFEKLASTVKRAGTEAKRQEGKVEVNGRESKYYCSAGYYDRVTYVKAKDPEHIMDYQHCFLIKYPYAYTDDAMVADQMITLLDDGKTQNGCVDPFEEGNESKPFLGVILVTVYRNSDSQEKILVDSESDQGIYEKMYCECKKVIETILYSTDDVFHEDCSKVFFTPNCADLCVVVRTDKLEHIYNLKRRISKQIFEEEKKNPSICCYTTAYTMFEPPENWETEKIKCGDVQIELRLSGSEEAINAIREELEVSRKGEVYGITGVGEFSMELQLQTFVEIYPIVWKLKRGIVDNCKSTNKTCQSQKRSLRDIFEYYQTVLRCSYIRVKYPIPKYEGIDKEYCLEKSEVGIVSRMEDDIKKLIKSIRLQNVTEELHFREQASLLKELLYTYNDFWYQQSSQWKGVVFFAQLESIKKGIEQYKEIIDLGEYEKNGPKNIVDKLSMDINNAISSVNDFNKLLQSMNQYVVNVPNYEMQTKVNVEKYLMAYTMYLFKISRAYYSRHSTEKVEKVLPLFTIDFKSEKIKAYTLFGELSCDKEPEDWSTLFVVLCPNYQWFANVYHVLPMITHEISHNFRYIGRWERNKFVLRFVIKVISKIFAEELLTYSIGQSESEFYGQREWFFVNAISDIMIKEIDSYTKNGTEFSKIRLKDLDQYLDRILGNITGLDDISAGLSRNFKTIQNEIQYLFDISGMELMSPADVGVNLFGNETPDTYFLFVNILLDILKQEDGLCNDWLAGLESLGKTKKDVLNNEIFKKMHNMLCIYIKEQTIYLDDITFALEGLVLTWSKKKPVELLRSQNEHISNCVKFLIDNQFGDLYKEIEKIDLGLNSGLEVTQEERFVEELDTFCNSICCLTRKGLWNEGGRIIAKESAAEKFGLQLHKRLHESYMVCLNNRHDMQYRWITFKKNQRLLTSMGVINEDGREFAKVYSGFLEKLPRELVRGQISDMLSLYEEVFADIGMCSAFGFSSYGYFMYSIHIIMKERGLLSSRARNFTVDRISTVLFDFYEFDENQDFYNKLEDYYKDLQEAGKDYLQVDDSKKFSELNEKMILDNMGKIRSVVDEQKEEKQKNEERRNLLKSWEMLRWMWLLWREFQINAENNKFDKYDMGLKKHIQKLKGDVTKELWVQQCREDSVINEIRDYYNMFMFSNSKQEKRLGTCLKYQHQFVLRYYSEMVDCVYQAEKRAKESHAGILSALFEDQSSKAGDNND